MNSAEQPVLRKKLTRDQMMGFFEKLAPTTIAIEACGGSHHWARLLGSFGHEIKLIAPQLAKPYVKRGKNDAADAERFCEALSRPTMRFAPTKTADQQVALMLIGMRSSLIHTIAHGYGPYPAMNEAATNARVPAVAERRATSYW